MNDKNKNIGVFSFDFFPVYGGMGRHLYETYLKAYKNNKKITIFSPNKNNVSIHKTIFNFLDKSKNTLLFSFLLNLKIDKFIDSYNLGIVHFHTGPGGLIITKKPNAKMICTVHHTYYQQQKYVPYQKWKYLLYLLERKMYKNTDKIIAVSDDTKNVLIENYKIKPNKIIVIPNGVDFKRFRKIKGIKKIKNSLLYVGRLDKRKGIDFLIKTIPLVKEKIHDVKLFVIGKGKTQDKLEKFIEKNELQENVKFLGFVPDEDLPKWYNKCKLTVVPSVFEGFGISVIESLACGTTVIGTNTDGIKTIIKNKQFLIPYGDKEKLAEKIAFLLKNKSKIDFNKNNYFWDNIAKKTLEVYNE